MGDLGVRSVRVTSSRTAHRAAIDKGVDRPVHTPWSDAPALLREGRFRLSIAAAKQDQHGGERHADAPAKQQGATDIAPEYGKQDGKEGDGGTDCPANPGHIDVGVVAHAS